MKVLVINGPMGVGKTATGQRIAETVPGTALIDGDWCMDIHPFVGNRETRAMAVDNILHMTGNYMRCSVCTQVVIAWLMDDARVRESLARGLDALGAETQWVTLVCGRESLQERWRNDRTCPWRTEEWLETSLASLPAFGEMENVLDTGSLTVEEVSRRILQGGKNGDGTV